MAEKRSVLNIIIDATGARRGADAVIASFNRMRQSQTEFQKFANQSINTIGQSFTNMFNRLSPFISRFFQNLRSSWQSFVTTSATALRSIGSHFATWISNMSRNFRDFIRNIDFSMILNRLRNIVTTLSTGFTYLFNQIYSIGAAFDKYQISFSVVTGSFVKARDLLDEILNLSAKLGINFEAAAVPFAKFVAAAQGLLSRGSISKVFTGFAETAAALQLNREEIQGIFLAIQQIASKGVVSMEELRLQLAERVPGAMTLAAKAWGTTLVDFEKQVQLRLVPAGEFLKKFADQLHNRFGAAAQAASYLMANSFERMRTTIHAFIANVSRSGFTEAMAQIFGSITKWFKDNQYSANSLGQWFGELADKISAFISRITPQDIADIFNSIVAGIRAVIAILPQAFALLKLVGSLIVGVVNIGVAILDSLGLTDVTSGIKQQTDTLGASMDNLTKTFNEKYDEYRNAVDSKKGLLSITINNSNSTNDPFADALEESIRDNIAAAYAHFKNLSGPQDLFSQYDMITGKIESILQRLRDNTDELETQRDISGQLITLYDTQYEVIDKIKQSMKSSLPDIRTNTEKIKDYTIYLYKLLGRDFISESDFHVYLTLYKEKLGELSDVGRRVALDLRKAFTNFGEDVASTFAKMVVTGEKSWADLRIAFETELIKMLSYRLIFEQLFAGLTNLVPEFPTGKKGGISSLPTGNKSKANYYNFSGPSEFSAQGNVFSFGRHMAFASGGVIGNSMSVPMATMGERGPEAIIPLQRTPSGDLGVKAGGGWGSTQVIVNDMRGAGEPPVEIKETYADGKRQVHLMIKAAMNDIIKSGGVDSSMRNSYGIKRKSR